MSGASRWDGEEYAVFHHGPTSSESVLFSDLFGTLSPSFAAAAQSTGLIDTVRVEAGDGITEEDVESAANEFGEAKSSGASTSRSKKVVKPSRDSTSRSKKEEAGGSCDYQQKRKRNRTAEMHNMTERRRRDKIKGKLKALQELIPNSHKLDRASLLDQTIEYMKSLQMQLHIISGGGLCHCCMPPSPGAFLHMPQFSPFLQMGTGYGMGMGTMGSPVCPPLMSIPSHPATSYVPMPGFSTIPSFCCLSQGVPFALMPEFSAAMITSIPSPPILQAEPFSSHTGEAGFQETVTTQKPNVHEPISTTC